MSDSDNQDSSLEEEDSSPERKDLSQTTNKGRKKPD
jgi:hypothetical protein